MNYNAAIIAQAKRHVGEKEFAGRASNPVIEAHFARAGFPGQTDDVPWCAAFIGSVLAECGLKPSGSLMARSYSSYGRKVSQQEAEIGDIGVIARGKPPSGHVFFIAGFEGENVLALGGNQGDAVTIKPIPLSSLIAIRRADPAKVQGLPTLVMNNGARDPDVQKLQTALTELGYPCGEVDGMFGRRVKDAVIKFQDANGLDPDGVVGDRTWAKLLEGKKAPLRVQQTEEKLRAKGSKTIKAADTQIGSAVLGGAGLSFEAVRRALDTVEQNQSALEWVMNYVKENWVLVALAALLVVGYTMAKRIQAERVRKAVTGEDLSL